MRELLRIARQDAPPALYNVDDIVAAGRRRKRWRLAQRAGGIGTAAAAVVTAGVLVISNLALSGGGGAAEPVGIASQPGPFVMEASEPFTFTFDGYRMGDYHVLPPTDVNLAYQSTNIVRYGKNYAKDKTDIAFVGAMTVYQPGVFRPEKFLSGTKLIVQGREAYRAQLTRMVSNQIDGNGNFINGEEVPYDALAWQYGPDAWAVIAQEVTRYGPQDLPATTQIAMAERFTLRTGEPVKARLPFRTGYLPAGYELLSVQGQSMTSPHSGMVTFVYGRADRSLESLTGPVDLQRIRKVPSIVVSLLWVDTPPPDAKKRTSRCNEGQHWCKLDLPGGEFWALAEDPSQTLADAELLKVLDNLDFATIKKANTWHPIA
ncbi:hypothetical protein [Phytohabitans rumicis]|nr:hypothetical protein [Phytohabitans rumicis]